MFTAECSKREALTFIHSTPKLEWLVDLGQAFGSLSPTIEHFDVEFPLAFRKETGLKDRGFAWRQRFECLRQHRFTSGIVYRLNGVGNSVVRDQIATFYDPTIAIYFRRVERDIRNLEDIRPTPNI